jgi:CRP-like cAMP-binding protein
MSYSLDDIRTKCESEEIFHWVQSFWNTMPEETRARCTLIQRDKDSILFYTGLNAEGVHFILSGTVKIYKEMPNGDVYEISEDPAPTILGETEAFLDDSCVRGTVICSTSCVLLRIPASIFRTWMRQCNEALYAMAVFIIQKNLYQHSKERTLLFTSGVKKLAYLLLQHYDRNHQGEDPVFAPNRNTITEQTSLNPRTISRCINKLSALDLITHEKRRVSISPAQSVRLRQYINENDPRE